MESAEEAVTAAEDLRASHRQEDKTSYWKK